MKVKNEYVQIILGNRTFIKKNMLLDVYLKRLFEAQIQPIHNTSIINTCYIKLDNQIENVEYDSELNPNDFNVKFKFNIETREDFKNISVLDKNFIKLKYIFDNKNGFEYDGNQYDASKFELLNNRKITAISFGYEDTEGSQNAIFSFIDTSNMNIIINRNENISIVRVDKFESDGICKGNDCPIHLANDILNWKDGKKAQLYSVGFGNILGEMEQEYLINNVNPIVDNTSISFNLARYKSAGKYPSENLFLGFTPIIDNSKYLIFKYRLYKINQYNVVTYLNEYYTMSVQNENFGNLNIKLKIERL